jgi:nicotinamide-nucleotide amidase
MRTMFSDDSLKNQARRLLDYFRSRDMKLATAESCTGGMIAAYLTSIAGSSDVFDRAFVTYSNRAKHEMLDVSSQTLERFGAVSSQTALEMANGALENSAADAAIAVTGIAGPGGGSATKPVGLVYVAIVCKPASKEIVEEILFSSKSRDEIRELSVKFAFDLLFARVIESGNQ